MKWLRYRIGDQEGFGTIDGDEIRVHAGSMFEHPRETGIRLRLSEITWLTPCVPSNPGGSRSAAKEVRCMRPCGVPLDALAD